MVAEVWNGRDEFATGSNNPEQFFSCCQGVHQMLEYLNASGPLKAILFAFNSTVTGVDSERF